MATEHDSSYVFFIKFLVVTELKKYLYAIFLSNITLEQYMSFPFDWSSIRKSKRRKRKHRCKFKHIISTIYFSLHQIEIGLVYSFSFYLICVYETYFSHLTRKIMSSYYYFVCRKTKLSFQYLSQNIKDVLATLYIVLIILK